jgi:hypothetical protein
MARRVLGRSGTTRKRRFAFIAPILVLAVFATMLIGASSAPALNLDASQYSIQIDTAGGRNDEPGQKDLTLQGTNTSNLPTAINVLWNWDETSVGGGNSLDGCTLFDTDATGTAGDGLVDFSFCAIVGNISSGNKTLELKSTVLYTCGDARNDRCTSPIAIVPLNQRSAGTTCQLSLNSATNPFGDNNDTRIFCTVVLADVGATSAELINTCSYPSQQPNSDPSDCVVVPGKANPTIASTPSLIPQDSASLTGQSGTGGSVTFKLYHDGLVSGSVADGVCDAGELVFQQTDASSPYATSNDGSADVGTLNGYTITAAGKYLWLLEYSGDADNNPSMQACGVENYDIAVIQ